jgi:tRNA(fMet)-specific endonuclease VapC
LKYLLDTNICVFLKSKRYPQLEARLRKTRKRDVAVSAVTEAELKYGAYKSSDPARNMTAVDALLATITVLPFESSAADAYGQVRAALEKSGQIIGPYDLMIASQAIAHRLTIVTNNVREFSRVPGLAVEDWTLS